VTEDAVVVAERILASMQAPFVLDGKEVRVGASVGVAQAIEGDGVDELLRNADLAMYGAKHGGKGRFELFAPRMHAEVLDRLELEADLRAAVMGLSSADNQFRLVYQPIVQLSTERLIGVEALVRWDHPVRGVVSPAIFIPLAEEMGLIRALGSWILREACAEAVSWTDGRGSDPAGTIGPGAFDGHPSISVNLSGRQLQHPDLVDEVAQILTETRLPPSRLVFEITESVIMRDTEDVLSSLRQLKELGIRLAIDDFGTGYSSLSYLQKFPVDILKIDKAFVDGVAAGGQAAALTRTIIALADMLSLRTVAEGIEGSDQSLHLQALGCGFGQGYLFAKPLSAEAAGALVRGGVPKMLKVVA
jgi:EAL domain-containing protein (putative c-di-GMP-specific phosphodiesterase class I)